MSIEIDAVYEDGKLKLDHPLPLEEHQRVRVVVHAESRPIPETVSDKDWWQALQGVLADQKRRGFVGEVTDVDRSDEGYEKRMREILGNTTHGSTDG